MADSWKFGEWRRKQIERQEVVLWTIRYLGRGEGQQSTRSILRVTPRDGAQ